MPDTTQNNALVGCDFDATTAKAVAGKNIVVLVTNKSGDTPLCIAGQQGLKFDMKAETSDAATKDDSTGGWSVKFHGAKSWSASVDGLWSIDDNANKMVASALVNDEYLCLKICQRIKTSNATEYKPIRMGLGIVTSDNFEAPNDDNATYSMDFDGSGKPWLIETATESEIKAATLTVAAQTVAEG